MSLSKNERDGGLDLLRVLAILGVIAIHAIAPVLAQSPIGSKRWMLGNVIDSSVRWCVPVFVMISGALLIRPNVFDKRLQFIRKRSPKILLAIAIWPIIYLLWVRITTGHTPDVHAYINSMVAGNPLPGHLYFLFIILGLYILTPLISLYAKHTPKKEFNKGVFFILLIVASWHWISNFVPSQHGSLALNSITFCLPYIGYFMAGYALKDFRAKRPFYYALVFLVTIAILTVVTAYLSKQHGLDRGLAFYSYTSLPVIIMSVSLFIFIREIYQRLKNARIVNSLAGPLMSLSNATFGVYLVHIIVLSAAVQYLHLDQISMKHVVTLYLITLFGSYAISICMLRLKYVRSIVS